MKMANEKDIPHGHGLSYKRGISDGIRGERRYEGEVHETHLASYQRGVEEGEVIRKSVGDRVRD